MLFYIFCPLYSPNYNPIEEAFSKVKIAMKSIEVEMQALDNIDTIIYAVFSTISPGNCKACLVTIHLPYVNETSTLATSFKTIC